MQFSWWRIFGRLAIWQVSFWQQSLGQQTFLRPAFCLPTAWHWLFWKQDVLLFEGALWAARQAWPPVEAWLHPV